MSIPLSQSLPKDKICWHWEKNGCYTVRSAYHLLSKIRENLQPGPSHHRNERLWKEIWKASIPNKVKNFMWRLEKNILPTRQNLQRKGIYLDTLCPICHADVETVEHLFMNCQLAKLSMFASPLGSHAPINTDMHCWLLEWLTCRIKEGSQLFCVILWKLWYERNQAVFKGDATEPVTIAQSAV